MAYSGNVGLKTFNALDVVQQAWRKCRVPAQAITAEMLDDGMDSLYLKLSSLANIKTPSWCIEQIVLPMYVNQPIVTLPVGTVDILECNYRTTTEITGTLTSTSTARTYQFTSASTITTVGITWSGASVPITLQGSTDGSTWVTLGSYSDTTATTGTLSWVDISAPQAYLYFRVNATTTLPVSSVYLGNNPTEINMARYNLDDYASMPNKTFTADPITTFYYQRDLPTPVLYLWPAPNTAATARQIVVWRHRHIMDTDTLTQTIEVPQRWLLALVDMLAVQLAQETPSVDINLLPFLQSSADKSFLEATQGDNNGSRLRLSPNIGGYTK